VTNPDAERTGGAPPQKSAAVRWLKLLVSGVLLGFLVYRATGNETLVDLWGQPKRWDWLLLALAMVATGYTISFLRWWVLTSSIGLQMSMTEAIRWGMISLPFQLVSFGVAGGDLLRIYYLCQHHPDRKTHVATTVVLDRAIGLAVMFATVAAVGLLINWQNLTAADARRTVALSWVWWMAVAVTVTMLGLAFALWQKDFAEWHGWVVAGIPSQRGQVIGRNLLQLLPLYRARPASLVLTVLLSFANVVCLSGSVACVARSLTAAIPGFSDHLLITPISLIAGAAPLPGGLGSQELVMSWLYAAFSTEQRNSDYGFLVAVGFRFLTLVLAGLGWLLYLQSGPRRRPAP
jgi:glycosyltransferase 2 family protein